MRKNGWNTRAIPTHVVYVLSGAVLKCDHFISFLSTRLIVCKAVSLHRSQAINPLPTGGRYYYHLKCEEQRLQLNLCYTNNRVPTQIRSEHSFFLIATLSFGMGGQLTGIAGSLLVLLSIVIKNCMKDFSQEKFFLWRNMRSLGSVSYNNWAYKFSVTNIAMITEYVIVGNHVLASR